MRIPVIEGLIKRRLLINFRVDPVVMQKMLPSPFRPKLHRGYAIAGICLIRLEEIRPAGIPSFMGVASENAAHRVAVQWDSHKGTREGVFIPRRDTASRLSHLGGGRLFPGEHYLADFLVDDNGQRVDFQMKSRDGTIRVRVRGFDDEALPLESCFSSVEESSRFFEGGSIGYSATRNLRRLDGLRLETKVWQVRALTVEEVETSFFADTGRFPKDSVQFDHALIMREIPHRWHSEESMIAGS
jgi:uncharacterized protein YqjF (DUF2071 family)